MTIRIQIDDNTMLLSDQYQYILAHPVKGKNRKTKEPEIQWIHDTFHTDLSQIANAYCQRRLRLSNTETFTELSVELENAVDTLSQALSSLSKVVIREYNEPST